MFCVSLRTCAGAGVSTVIVSALPGGRTIAVAAGRSSAPLTTSAVASGTAPAAAAASSAASAPSSAAPLEPAPAAATASPAKKRRGPPDQYQLEGGGVLSGGFQIGAALHKFGGTNSKGTSKKGSWSVAVGETFGVAKPHATAEKGTYLCVAPLFHPPAAPGSSKKVWELLAIRDCTSIVAATAKDLVAVGAAAVQPGTIAPPAAPLTDAERIKLHELAVEKVTAIVELREKHAKAAADAAAVAPIGGTDPVAPRTRAKRKRAADPACKPAAPAHRGAVDDDGDAPAPKRTRSRTPTRRPAKRQFKSKSKAKAKAKVKAADDSTDSDDAPDGGSNGASSDADEEVPLYTLSELNRAAQKAADAAVTKLQRRHAKRKRSASPVPAPTRAAKPKIKRSTAAGPHHSHCHANDDDDNSGTIPTTQYADSGSPSCTRCGCRSGECTPNTCCILGPFCSVSPHGYAHGYAHGGAAQPHTLPMPYTSMPGRGGSTYNLFMP